MSWYAMPKGGLQARISRAFPSHTIREAVYRTFDVKLVTIRSEKLGANSRDDGSSGDGEVNSCEDG